MDLSDLRSSLDKLPELNTKNLAYTLTIKLDAAFKNQPVTNNGKPLFVNPRILASGEGLTPEILGSFIDTCFVFYRLVEERDARLNFSRIPVKLYSQVGTKVERLVPTAPIHLGKSDNFI
jgi:hypothetical protein